MKVYTCPDCGKKFQEGFVPSECPGCGCPSNVFTVSELASQATNTSPSLEKSLSKYIRVVGILMLTFVIIGFFTELWGFSDNLEHTMTNLRQISLISFWVVLLYFNRSKTKLLWIIIGGVFLSILPLFSSILSPYFNTIWLGVLLGGVCLLMSDYFQGTMKSLLIIFFALKIVQTIAYFLCVDYTIPYLAYVIIYYLAWLSITFFCVLFPQYPEESNSFSLALGNE